MANEPGVRVVGLNRLLRTLRRAGEDISELKEAHTAAARIVAAYAQAHAPRRSGKLAGTVRPMRVASRARIAAGTRAIPYANPIHWGWAARGITAQPWISHAGQVTESQWEPAYVRDVQRALDRVVGA